MKGQWFCEHHHDKRAYTYCEDHQEVFCDDCSVKAHAICYTKDIQDEIAERKHQLAWLIERGEAQHEKFKQHDVQFNRKADSIDNRLKALEDEAASAVVEETQKVNEEKERIDEEINREIDEEIAKLNEERNRRLEQNRGNSRWKLDRIEAEKRRLTKDLHRLKAEFKGELEKVANALANLVETIGTAHKLISEEVDLLTDFKSTMHLLQNGIEIDANMKGIDDLVCIAEKISLLRVTGQVVGKIGAYRLEQKDEFPTELSGSTMLGAIGSDEIAFRNKNNSIHIVNLKDKSNRRVLKGKSSNYVWSCAALADGRIVCGTNAAQILVYDSQWDSILKTISMAYTSKTDTLVSVTSDGLVLATIQGESTISFFNPDDGGFLKMIPVKDTPIHGLHSLPSGAIALITKCSVDKDLCFLNTDGNVTNTTHLHGRDDIIITGERHNDSIHVVSWDHHIHEATITLTSPSGVVTAEEKISCPRYLLYDSSCALSGSGKFVVHMSDKLFMYKETLQDVSTLLKYSTHKK